MHDVKSWIALSMEPLNGHATPHCFKFLKVANGEVKMFYKCWSSDPWCKEEKAVTLLMVHNHYKIDRRKFMILFSYPQTLPTGIPLVLSPSPDKMELKRLSDDIPKFYKWISSSSAAVWELFLRRELKDYLSVHDDPWVMGEVFNACQTLVTTSQSTPSENSNVPEDLEDLLASSINPTCEVNIFKRTCTF